MIKISIKVGVYNDYRKQVVQYLKNKDQDYIDNLLDHIKNSCSSNDKSGSKIICPICGSSSIKKNGKDVYENNVIFVMNVIDLLVKTLKHCFLFSFYKRSMA